MQLRSATTESAVARVSEAKTTPLSKITPHIVVPDDYVIILLLMNGLDALRAAKLKSNYEFSILEDLMYSIIFILILLYSIVYLVIYIIIRLAYFRSENYFSTIALDASTLSLPRKCHTSHMIMITSLEMFL